VLEAGIVLETALVNCCGFSVSVGIAGLDWLECRVGQVEVEGLRIAYERAGEGPPLLLLQGFVGDVRLPPNRGGIDYKESHARAAEEVRR
jgi:hypothetical protein